MRGGVLGVHPRSQSPESFGGLCGVRDEMYGSVRNLAGGWSYLLGAFSAQDHQG